METLLKTGMRSSRWCIEGGRSFMTTAMKMHLYRNMYGDTDLETAHMAIDEYNPLSFQL